jgi:TonB-dependent starch-binding outer membrane protein SusC
MPQKFRPPFEFNILSSLGYSVKPGGDAFSVLSGFSHTPDYENITHLYAHTITITKPKSLIMNKVYRSFRKVASVLLLLLGFLTAQAQDRTVTGKITDQNGMDMPGVNVVIKGTTKGTTTNISGVYSLEASQDDILVISFIGYTTQERRVGTATSIDVVLEEDVATLQEVVVVGYGTQKKSDLTGAVSSVDGEKIRNSVTASVDQALQGRVAGVQVTQNSGQPGGAVSIRIRGTTSLTQSSEPLYVIDGIQVGGNAGGIAGFDWQGGAGGQQAGATNPLAAINPNDIESIEVLKDASATAIFGSRGAAGVVIITTKRGKKGIPLLTYNGFYSIQDVYKTFDMMNLQEYAAYNNEVADEVSSITPNERFADPTLLGRGTDWQAAIFQPAPMQSHSLTLSGGTDNTTYVFSGGYFKQEGIIIGSDFERFNTRLKLDTKVRDNIKIGANLSLGRRFETITLNDGGDGVISQAAQMPPHIPVRDFDGSFAGPDQQNGSSQIGSNPVALALLRNNTVLNNRVMSNIFGDIEILKGLSFLTEVNLDYSNTKNIAFQPSYQWGSIGNPTSRLGVRADESLYWAWNNRLSYHKQFGSHDVSVMVAQEAQKGRWESMSAFKINVPNDIPELNQGDTGIEPTGDKNWFSLASYFARVNYTYGDRYLLTATLRRDGSSRFGPQKQWGWFPSVSVGWKLNEESFLAGSELISQLKLRAGWGTTGNQEIANYAFASALVTENTEFGGAVRNTRYSNPLLQWESTTQYNVGVDLGLLDDRINFTAEVYLKKTDDLLLEVSLPATFGSQVAGPYANIGKMENKGVELGLNSVNVDNGKFKWSTAANVTINRNSVTEMAGTPLRRNLYWYTGFQSATMTAVGYPVSQFYGYVMEGLFKTKEEIQNHAVQIAGGPDGTNLIEKTTGVWLGDVKWKDLNNDGIINSQDQTVIGDPNPDFTFGFDNTFSYGPLSLYVQVIGTIGGDILNYSRARNEQMITTFDNQSRTVVNRARTQLKEGGTDINNIDHIELVNPDTDIPRFDNGAENFNHHLSTRWIEDGTFVRVQNLRLSYQIPGAALSKIKISRAQVFGNIQNVATLTKYKGLDPQIGSFNQSSLMMNVDMGRYPSPRVFTLGVNIDF